MSLKFVKRHLHQAHQHPQEILEIFEKGLCTRCIAQRITRGRSEGRKFYFAEDEELLDGAGNLIDRKGVVEVLDNESDYEKGLEKLDTRRINLLQGVWWR